MGHNEELCNGLISAFIDKKINSNFNYLPEFVSNDYLNGKRVISTIENELINCDEFCFSLAFISLSGITPLLETFKELEEKGIKGRILTTDYLTFNDPKALDKLHELKNIELKFYSTANDSMGFHTKGYIFRKGNLYYTVVGSSNLTGGALKVNKEWNTKLVGYKDGGLISDILDEFEDLWSSEKVLDYEEFIESYRVKYEIVKRQQDLARLSIPINLEQYQLKPNRMQVEFVKNVQELIDKDIKKALLISATGTGKTYASAFCAREINAKKVLFVVHREQIAKQAMESYKRVFGEKKIDGSNYCYALLSGNTSNKIKEIKSADLIFATMQLLSKDYILSEFDKNLFDVICLDEAHHSGADSYQKIMNHFTPGFYLGMTASPETNRFDVFEIFDHNIAYEIRLEQALKEDLLCPFHYFGISDIVVDGKVIGDEDQGDLRSFNRLVSDNRVDYIIEKANYFGYSGNRVKGLIFCSRKEEAIELSKKLNLKGLRTCALTGENSESQREEAIDRLVNDDRVDNYDYILTIDIFSEGVDIPEINQVIMLRPTQSAIVFVQQLGRGLRKFKGKEFVVIIDFIGNYKNNYLIPIALSGDRTYNKDNIRRHINEGNKIIPGESTIHFDEISRKRIYQSIDAANFSNLNLIKDNYINLKYKLGRIPNLSDFDKYGEMDVCRIFDNNSLGSYYKFLCKYEKEYKVRLSNEEEKYIEFISRKLASGKRIQELELIKQLLTKKQNVFKEYNTDLQKEYGIMLDESSYCNLVNVMTNNFITGTGSETYKNVTFIKEDDGEIDIDEKFEKYLKNKDFCNIVKELVDFGISRYQEYYKNRYENTDLVLYQKYTYEDVCRILGWDKSIVAQNIGGYKYDEKTKTFPVFINYDKSSDISDTINYEDSFVDNKTLIAISKAKTHIYSESIDKFLNANELGITVHLFVRKNKDDKISKEFYYLGTMHASGNAEEFIMKKTKLSAVKIEWILDTPVREDIYQYIIG